MSVEDKHIPVSLLAAKPHGISRYSILRNLFRSGSMVTVTVTRKEQSRVCFCRDLHSYRRRDGVLQRRSLGSFCSGIYSCLLCFGFCDTHHYSYFFISSHLFEHLVLVFFNFPKFFCNLAQHHWQTCICTDATGYPDRMWTSVKKSHLRFFSEQWQSLACSDINLSRSGFHVCCPLLRCFLFSDVEDLPPYRVTSILSVDSA